MTETIIDVSSLTKTYPSGDSRITVLNQLTFSLRPGETCAVMGPSGSGKTTLLGLCAGLDDPDSGNIRVAGRDLARLSQEERAQLRRDELGFVFQSFRLLPTLTAVENVMVPLELRREADAEARATELLSRVGLGDRLLHYPTQLSGGEQQRVALARAFIHRPRILFADEPTGSLDTETGDHIANLLFELNHTEKTTLVLVTHNADLANRTGRVLKLSRGSLVSDGVATLD